MRDKFSDPALIVKDVIQQISTNDPSTPLQPRETYRAIRPVAPAKSPMSIDRLINP